MSAIESAFWMGDVRVTRLGRAEAPAREAMILFHGFPGQPPAAEAHKYKNFPKLRVEVARAAPDVDAFLPGYAGLGESRGRFGFARAVTRSAELAAEIAARGYKRVHVIGHSWGAFVAFNVRRALGAAPGRLVLLSGLLDLADEAAVRAFLTPYVANYPEILGADAGALERAVADLDAARRAFNPLTLAAPSDGRELLTVLSRFDAYVDPEASRRLHRRAGGRLLELDDDHIYSRDMPRVVAEIVRFVAL